MLILLYNLGLGIIIDKLESLNLTFIIIFYQLISCKIVLPCI